MAVGRGLEHFAVGVGSDEKGNTRHMAKKKSPAGADQPRSSKALRALRESLGLDEEGWQAYLWHARHGLADFEQANFRDPKSTLQLRDVPAGWFSDPEALGYVVLRILTEGEADLIAPVTRHFLRVCAPSPAASTARRGSAWRGCTWPGWDWNRPSHRPA